MTWEELMIECEWIFHENDGSTLRCCWSSGHTTQVSEWWISPKSGNFTVLPPPDMNSLFKWVIPVIFKNGMFIEIGARIHGAWDTHIWHWKDGKKTDARSTEHDDFESVFQACCQAMEGLNE